MINTTEKNKGTINWLPELVAVCIVLLGMYIYYNDYKPGQLCREWGGEMYSDGKCRIQQELGVCVDGWGNLQSGVPSINPNMSFGG